MLFDSWILFFRYFGDNIIMIMRIEYVVYKIIIEIWEKKSWLLKICSLFHFFLF